MVADLEFVLVLVVYLPDTTLPYEYTTTVNASCFFRRPLSSSRLELLKKQRSSRGISSVVLACSQLVLEVPIPVFFSSCVYGVSRTVLCCSECSFGVPFLLVIVIFCFFKSRFHWRMDLGSSQSNRHRKYAREHVVRR